jgi:hypothetical protein
LDIKDLRTIHKKALQKLHTLVGANISIEYIDGSKGVVKCTLSDEKVNVFSNDKYIEKDMVNFRILKQELKDNELPVKGFKKITFNRETYEVNDVTESSTMGNALVIRCVKLG